MLEYQGFLICACILYCGGKRDLAICAAIMAIIAVLANPVFTDAVSQGYHQTR